MSKSKIKPIRSEADYQASLARIDALMDAKPGTPEGEEPDVLVGLVELYEAKHVPMGYPSPVAAIECPPDPAGLTRRGLVPFPGTRSKVSEPPSRKGHLT